MAASRRTALALAVLIASLSSVPASGRASPLSEDSPISREDREDFTWFDNLGFLSAAGRPFVRVTRTSEPPDKGDEPFILEGFLLRENPDSVTLIGAGVYPETCPLKIDGYTMTKEPADLRTTATDCVKALRERVRERSWGAVVSGFGRLCNGPEGWLDTSTEGFILARRCAENGLDGLAADLLAVSREYMVLGMYRRKDMTLRELVEEEIAEATLSTIVRDHGDPELTRPRLVLRYDEWLRRFPRSADRAGVEADRKVLKAMVDEDAAHVAVPDERLAALPAEQRVRELLFRLRDEAGQQMSDPGAPSIYGDDVWQSVEEEKEKDKEKRTSIPSRIEAIGIDAVPALIDALEDTRFTRVLGFHRSWSYRSYYVIRIGDAAREILDNITKQSFWKRRNTTGSMIKDGQAKETKERYLAWWKSRKPTRPVEER